MDGFSVEWETTYAGGAHLNRWPWSDLVSLTISTLGANFSGKRVLEIGCGYGPNIPFFLDHKAEYFAVDGSRTAVSSVIGRFPGLSEKIKVADFTESLPFTEPFDLIVDRAALTHNSTASISKALRMVHERLKPDGFFIGLDWFADDHSSFSTSGEQVHDSWTRTGFLSGPFAGVGLVHFSSRSHLEELFNNFEFSLLEKKQITAFLPSDGFMSSAWNFIVRQRRC